MNRIKFFLVTFFVFNLFTSTQWIHAAAEVDGKTLFKDNCKACHTIGKGKLVGPDLKDVDKKRNEAWLFKWIKSSKSMINSNDSDALALFTEFNKAPMNEFPNLTELQIKTILDYIKAESNSSGSVASNAAVPQSNETNSNQGPALFSTPFNLLLGLIGLLLLVIYFLAQSIKRLSEQLSDFYSNDRSFF